ncbi:MAG: hypothetical protein H7246_17410 [Phycisphaerae bacterium]|nr:hypothetical protein [Saprospiraceae bacterium]
MKHLVLCHTALLFLVGCLPGDSKQPSAASESNLLGTWELADISNLQFENTAAKSALNDQQDVLKGQILKNGLVRSFFSDGSYTELTGESLNTGDKSGGKDLSEAASNGTKNNKYNYGQWKAIDNNTKLALIPQDGSGKETQAIRTLDQKFMVVHVANDQFSCDLKFRRTGKPLGNIEADPFHMANNQWRVTPKQAETDEQLRARLRNHIQHYIALLEASLEREQNVVSPKYSPSIIQIYNGGIGIREKEAWDEAFMHCFYNQQDAQKGVDLYTKVLDKGLSLGAGTGDWVKDDANLLRMILTELQ